MSENWTENPKLAHLDQEKLNLLSQLASEGSHKSASELLPFLISASKGSRGQRLSFSEEDIELLLEVLTSGKSPQETARLKKIIALAKSIR
jgi:hypothetical protein